MSSFTSSGRALRFFLLFHLTSRALLGVWRTRPEFSTPSIACLPSQSIYQAGRCDAKNMNSFPVRATDGPMRPQLVSPQSTKDNKFLLSQQESSEPTTARYTALRCWGHPSTTKPPILSFGKQNAPAHGSTKPMASAEIDRRHGSSIYPRISDGPNRIEPQPW